MKALSEASAKPPSDRKPHERHGAPLRLPALLSLPPLRGASISDPKAWSDKLIQLKGLGVPLPPPDPWGATLRRRQCH